MPTTTPVVTEERRKAFLAKVSKNLKLARLSADFDNQTQAARAIGCCHDRVSRAEAGNDIKISDLLEYAIAYKCDIKKFFE